MNYHCVNCGIMLEPDCDDIECAQCKKLHKIQHTQTDRFDIDGEVFVKVGLYWFRLVNEHCLTRATEYESGMCSTYAMFDEYGV